MKMKRQPTERANIFAHHMSGKGLVSNTYKELLQLTSKKTAQMTRESCVDNCLKTTREKGHVMRFWLLLVIRKLSINSIGK